MSQQGFEPGTNYVAPQPQPTTAPMIQSGEGGISAVAVNQQSTRGKYLKTMRSLGIAEVVLGGLVILIGVIRAFVYYYAVIEGIWCGSAILIIVSGSLGIVTGKPNPSNCMINTRMTFAIIGSVFAGSGFSMSVIGTLYSYHGFLTATSILAALIFLIALVLLIVSSGYCCAINGCCCDPHSSANFSSPQAGQMIYTHQQFGYPVTQSVYPGYATQGYQPMQQMQPIHTAQQMQFMELPNWQPGVVPLVNPVLDPTYHATPVSQQKQQEAQTEDQTANISDPPPSYQPN